jgi:hypothetical protein
MDSKAKEAEQRFASAFGWQASNEHLEFHGAFRPCILAQENRLLRLNLEGISTLLVERGICSAADLDEAIAVRLNAESTKLEQANGQREGLTVR